MHTECYINSLPKEGRECIKWPFSIKADGRATMHRKGHTMNAATYVCTKFHGPKPSPKHDAAHSCGKGHEACIAPYHLSWKTRADNLADRLVHGTHRFGDRINTTKLTADQVVEIRELFDILPHAEIGKRYNVSKAAIRQIATGKTWSHV